MKGKFCDFIYAWPLESLYLTYFWLESLFNGTWKIRLYILNPNLADKQVFFTIKSIENIVS